MGGAENGNENCKGDSFRESGTDYRGQCRGGNTSGMGNSVRAEGGNIAKVGKNINHNQNRDTNQKCEGKIATRIYGFSRRVCAVLPTLVGPQNTDHRQPDA